VTLLRTGDPGANTDSPSNDFAGSGWKYVGHFGGFCGTPIAQHFFLTASYVGQASSVFTFEGKDYTLVQAYLDDPGPGLAIWSVKEAFPYYAPLYKGNGELGQTILAIGRGRRRGPEVTLDGNLRGWQWGDDDRTQRWGKNQVTEIVRYSTTSEYLIATFDQDELVDECQVSGGDDGGPVFLDDNGVWKLAGIIYGVDGPYYTDNFGTGRFLAALFDGRGFWVENYPPPPNFIQLTGAVPVPSAFSMARISNRNQWIESVINPPHILQQPEGKTVQTGNPATLTVSATGAAQLTYEWWLGANLFRPATDEPTLVINNAQSSNAGKYTVVIKNDYGSAVSVPANLTVLSNLDTVPPPQPPTYPVVEPMPGKDSLVLVTHGWTLLSPNQTWIDDMGSEIASVVGPNWAVKAVHWENIARTLLPGTALYHAKQVGFHLGKQLVEQGWTHIHFIAHSAGAGLIQAATEYIKSHPVSGLSVPDIHETFLDPYLGIGHPGRASYGAQADWADNYFSHDVRGEHPYTLTEGRLVQAHNVEVTWLDPDRAELSIFPPAPDGCTREAASSHGWPHGFYHATIPNNGFLDGRNYGYPRSKEAGGWGSRGAYPRGESAIVLGGVRCFAPPDQPTAANTSLNFSQVPHGNSVTGILQFTPVGFQATTGGLQRSARPSRMGGTGRGGPTDTSTSYSPVWLVVPVETQSTINFVQFDAEFTSAAGAAGVMTLYWNDQEIGTIDERNVSLGIQTYVFGVPASFTDRNNSLGFRVDQFSDVASTVSVTNVMTGFAGTGAVPTLQISKTEQYDVGLTLGGNQAGTYVLEASTDLATWNPIATVTLSAGTPVTLSDADASSFVKRFYRAVAP